MKQVLFIQGGGEGAYAEDKKLVASLEHELGSGYHIEYPRMPDEENAPYDEWVARIENHLAKVEGPLALVGHSVGASVLIKHLTEIEPPKPVIGVFLMANPFWGGEGWRYEGWETLALSRRSMKLPMFLYHSRNDEVVPFDHLALYSQVFPHATVRVLETGGHQLDGQLSVVADDIKSLQ